MIKACGYRDLETIPDQNIKEIMKHEFIKFWKLYGMNQELLDYKLGELGEFVYLEDKNDSSDLSPLGYTGSLTDQLYEFVEVVYQIYKAVLIRDTDGGTIFYAPAACLDDKTKSYFNKIMEGAH